MLTTVTTWLIVIGATILASLAMWTMRRMETGRRLEVIRKRFFCPTKGKEVEVDFLARVWGAGNLLGVRSCSAFKEREKINCGKACLHLSQAQAAPVLFHLPLSPTVARGNGVLV